MQCRGHAVQLGRMYEQLRARDTEVLIIGGGRRKGAERLSARLKLPFSVLVDPDPGRLPALWPGQNPDRTPAQWHLSDRQTGHRALHPPGQQSPGLRGKRRIDARSGAIIPGRAPPLAVYSISETTLASALMNR